MGAVLMQVVSVLFPRGQLSHLTRTISTTKNHLEILRELGVMLDDSWHWMKISGRIGGFDTPEAVPTIIVRPNDRTADERDTVELWWNGGLQECYRLGEIQDLFGGSS